MLYRIERWMLFVAFVGLSLITGVDAKRFWEQPVREFPLGTCACALMAAMMLGGLIFSAIAERAPTDEAEEPDCGRIQ